MITPSTRTQETRPQGPTLRTHIPQDDLLPSIEDDLIFNAVRGGKLVAVRWNDLTLDERRAAYVNDFAPNY